MSLPRAGKEAHFLQAPGSCQSPLDQLLGGKSTLVAVSRADFLLVEATCRCLAESKDEEEMCVPLQDTAQQDQHQAFALVTTFSRAAGMGPPVQHHVNGTFGNPGSALWCQFILGAVQTVSLCPSGMAMEKHRWKHVERCQLIFSQP